MYVNILNSFSCCYVIDLSINLFKVEISEIPISVTNNPNISYDTWDLV